jgi:hypothetical protein
MFPPSSLDRLPIAFKCPACRKVIRTTREFLRKEPLACPKCFAEIERAKIEADVKKSFVDYGRTVTELEGAA